MGWVERELDGGLREIALRRDDALLFACRFLAITPRVGEDGVLNRDNLHFLGEWSWEGFEDGARRVMAGRRPVGTTAQEWVAVKAASMGCVTRRAGAEVAVGRPEPFAELLDVAAFCADWADYFADCSIDPQADELFDVLSRSGPRDYLTSEDITAWDNATIAAVGVALGYPGWFISAGVREGYVEVPGGVEYGAV